MSKYFSFFLWCWLISLRISWCHISGAESRLKDHILKSPKKAVEKPNGEEEKKVTKTKAELKDPDRVLSATKKRQDDITGKWDRDLILKSMA